jgi:hypothetical protein
MFGVFFYLFFGGKILKKVIIRLRQTKTKYFTSKMDQNLSLQKVSKTHSEHY